MPTSPSPSASPSPEAGDDPPAPSSTATAAHPTGPGAASVPQPTNRIPLACLRCRSKKSRCPGPQPVCGPCEKARAECVWPSGRKRKRTRREMMAAEMEADAAQKHAEAAAAAAVEEGGRAAAAALMGLSAEGVQPHAWQSPFPLQQPPPVPPVPLSFPPSAPEPTQSLHLPPILPPTNQSSVWPTSFYPAPPRPPHPPLLSYPRPGAEPDAGAAAPGPSTLASLFPPAAAPQQQQQHNADVPIENVMQAVTSRIAYIEDDDPENIKVHYYRLSGPSAIHPGLNRICLKLRNRRSSGARSPASSPGGPLPPVVFDPISDLPLPSVYRPLLDRFFKYFGQHWPFLERGSMEGRLADGTMSAFLLSAICAVSARFAPTPPKIKSVDAGQVFVEKANELVVSLLRLPSTDVVVGLLLLSWCEFGQNSESGLWQFSGMAIRMALDLGLHKCRDDSLFETPEEARRARLLFWSLFIMDRVLAFGTGRPVTISEDLIELPLPEDTDLPPPPNLLSPPSAFPSVVRLMVLCGRIADTLNGQRRRAPPLSAHVGVGAEGLQLLQAQLIEFYGGLPAGLRWTVDNLKAYAAADQAGLFLFLHLWPNAVLALVQHPTLLNTPDGGDMPVQLHANRSVSLSLASSRAICECLVFADLFSAESYTATPFLSQPIFVAGCAFIHEARTHSSKDSGSDARMLSTLAQQNLGVLLKALKRMEEYWAGLGYIVSVLEQRAQGLDVDFSITSDKVETFISLPDRGILRRFSQGGMSPKSRGLHPIFPPPTTQSPTSNTLRVLQNTNPATMTTEELNSWPLDALLSSHFVEEVSVGPFDLSQLDLPMALNSV